MSNTTSSYDEQNSLKSYLEYIYLTAAGSSDNRSVHTKIRNHLSKKGVSFEGCDLPLSLRPTIFTQAELAELSLDLGIIRDCLNIVISRLKDDLSNNKESALTKFFSHYKLWYQSIAEESRTFEDIMLMRFDLALSDQDLWLAMEPNCACPGGVIHCAHIRQAWLSCEIGQAISEQVSLEERAIDNPDGFLLFLDSLAKKHQAKNVAICNYKGTYTNELSSLESRSETLFALGKTSGKVVLADIMDIEVKDGKTIANGVPVGIIYNKIDQLAVDPQSPQLKGWFDASKSDSCTFLNSLGAMYIGEAKSIFAAISNDQIVEEIGLTLSQVLAINRRIPKTVKVRDEWIAGRLDALKENRHQYVLKEDAATRGEGVVIGEQSDLEFWKSKVTKYSQTNAIAQMVIDVPKRHVLNFDENSGSPLVEKEYYGADCFFFGGEFAGAVSRCHSSKVFNVGNGGQEVPTIVLKGRAPSKKKAPSPFAPHAQTANATCQTGLRIIEAAQ